MHALLNAVQYTCQCKEIQCQAGAVGEVERIHAARALVIECPASLQCIPHANNPLDIHFKPPILLFCNSKVAPWILTEQILKAFYFQF